MFGRRQPRTEKPPKERLVPRLKRRGRETWSLGQTLWHEPRAFPAQAGDMARRGFRRMWEARGGGFYACGFVVTFVALEVLTFIDEVTGSDGIIAFFTEQFWEFIVRFSVQSIGNTVQAFLWPLLVLQELGNYGFLFLISAYALFALLIKDRLTAWLFSPDEVVSPADGVSAPDEDRPD